MARATDDERREVAENLRTMCVYGVRYKEQFYDLLEETVMNVEDFHEFYDVADRLAYLIDPGDTSHGCRDTVTCDREALLALADEMEQETGSVCGVCMGKTARRIREACGVVA